MKNHFKKTTLILAGAAIIFASACNDDEGNEEPKNSLTIEGENFQFIDGTIEDYGAYAPLENQEQDSHSNWDFMIADGEFSLSSEEDFPESFNAVVYCELFSPGIDGFKTGTFNYMDLEGASVANIQNKYIFSDAAIGIDGNNNNLLFETTADQKEDKVYLATAGTIQVVPHGNHNYTLNYDLTFAEADNEAEKVVGQPFRVKFSYTGDFKYNGIEDNSSGRIAPKTFSFKK